MGFDYNLRHPFPRTWWIAAGRLLGGCFPGDLDADRAARKLTALFEAGIRRIVCLQPEDEIGRGGRPFPSYADTWRAIGEERGEVVDWQRHPCPDMGVPTIERMRHALDAIGGDALPAYVHCWGGHGRTGTLAACYLVERGMSVDDALERIRQARAHDAHLQGQPSPQTDEQIAFVRTWAERATRRL